MQSLPSLLQETSLTPDAAELQGRAVSGACDDSRDVRAGDLFVCMPSASRDTHEFLDGAAASGATAALVHSPAGLQRAKNLGLDAAFFPPGFRFFEAASRLAQLALGDPTKSLRVVGVTGTNGKTTTAWMLRDALRALGSRAAYMGTLGLDLGVRFREIPNTTPFPVQTARMMAEAVAAGCQDFVMETSSHALAEGRVEGVHYDAAVFTNLTQDHLDFHGTMESYAEAKKRLFTDFALSSRKAGKSFVSAINAADDWGRTWLPSLPPPVLTYNAPDADLLLRAEEVKVDSIRLEASFGAETVVMSLQVGGLFNVENAGSALAGLLALGYDLTTAARAMESVTAVPGRFEAVPNSLGIGILVDYAHTPDALELLLKSVRGLKPRRIICVFGCGGDRDRTKRPKMAGVVSRNAEVAVATSDNPRTEDPNQILADVVAGIEAGADSVAIIDRSEAVAHAVGMAEPGDVVVIAGKGHENYQIIGKVKHPMDDRELARAALAKRGG